MKVGEKWTRVRGARSKRKWGSARAGGAQVSVCILYLGLLTCLAWNGVACGVRQSPLVTGPAVRTTASVVPDTEVSTAAGTTPSTTAGASAGTSGDTEADAPAEATADKTTGVFAKVAKLAAPMPVYGLPDLPEGARVAVDWWPVVEVGSPAEYHGEATVNPRILGGEGYEPEIQIVLKYLGGWLAILENFRGDLGEVSGAEVGSVAGHTAVLYEVNGGDLVQWSDGGRWYGVFGRGLRAADVVKVALEMRLISADDAQ
jgi:hypothetical protein